MRVLLTGGAGMLGSSIAEVWPTLRAADELIVATRSDADLTDRAAVAALIGRTAPDAIVHTAAKVAGIQAKLQRPTDFLLDNLLIDTSVIRGAIDAGVPELLYVSSAAIYPEGLPQPIGEDALLSGTLEGANEGYALAKIAGTKLCEYASRQYGFAYRAAVPSNLYGPGDDYTHGQAHLIAAALGKVHAAVTSGSDEVEVWGDGTARREFTYTPDLAAWLVTQLGSLDAWPVTLNLGPGVDHSITEYYEAAGRAAGFTGHFRYDATKPSGVHQRLLDSAAARALGWNPTTPLAAGVAASYHAYLAAQEPQTA